MLVRGLLTAACLCILREQSARATSFVALDETELAARGNPIRVMHGAILSVEFEGLRQAAVRDGVSLDTVRVDERATSYTLP